MKRALSKAEAQAWMRRWRAVNEFQRQELRRVTVETKARQLAAMMRMALALGWQTSTDEELDRVRALWVQLKKTARPPARPRIPLTKTARARTHARK